jgi:DNA topoisomerase IA
VRPFIQPLDLHQNAREEIASAVRRYRLIAAELQRAAESRDRAIVEGAAAGLSRRQLAREAGLTVGRVQQIVVRGVTSSDRWAARFDEQWRRSTRDT